MVYYFFIDASIVKKKLAYIRKKKRTLTGFEPPYADWHSMEDTELAIWTLYSMASVVLIRNILNSNSVTRN